MNELAELLGRIDGKLDQVIKSVDRHIDDDVRRFGEVYKRLDSNDADINKAKGAKGALILTAGAAATVISLAVAAAGKFL